MHLTNQKRAKQKTFPIFQLKKCFYTTEVQKQQQQQQQNPMPYLVSYLHYHSSSFANLPLQFGLLLDSCFLFLLEAMCFKVNGCRRHSSGAPVARLWCYNPAESVPSGMITQVSIFPNCVLLGEEVSYPIFAGLTAVSG